jgi:hypothetical protein
VEKPPKKLLEVVSDVIVKLILFRININRFRRSRSIKIYRTGTIVKLKKVVAIVPPLSVVPKDSELSELTPLGKSIGSKTRMKTEIVINGEIVRRQIALNSDR